MMPDLEKATFRRRVDGNTSTTHRVATGTQSGLRTTTRPVVLVACWSAHCYLALDGVVECGNSLRIQRSDS